MSGRSVNSRSMTWLNKARFFNVTVALVAVLAWFTGTNHCWLAPMRDPGNAAVSMSHCPQHSGSAGGSDDASSRMSACCQGLQSPNFEPGKAKIAFSPVLVALRLFALSHLVLPETPKSFLRRTEYDTGPPSSGFFVGTVLRRSLCENAPPLWS